MQVDTFGAYVRAELEHWGREFALHRDCDYLGHQAKNLLAVLIEHRGEMPGRAQGYKPLETDHRAQMIEDIVASISRDNVAMACALRAYYCGHGRKKVERFETAILLMANSGHCAVSTRQYLNLVELGFQRLRGRLEAAAIAA
ncbi:MULTISPECIES: hypothetical protein [unclassified Stenotrophomonas]|uniref:hypothetical protein n=1 Tax=unclassified Stenotrophomonas TaxID=196198 RepID=UPI000D16D12E|nr:MULTISPECIES: hypothetical protein [unclassified Stenotrophomonas]PTA70495.1 hypothetical protein C9412_17115 [Stenotrophomonas sp. Nf1]PTA77377.1 hypothetical protein C9416_15890 [Stenotrophomonas sp. Nf4]